MENQKNKLVVVLSRNYSTGLSVIRSLGEAGYTVDLVASALREGKSQLAACSKYVRNSTEVVSKKVKSGGDEALLKELLKYKGTTDYKPVLFPTDDYTCSVMDMNRSVLEEIFIMPTLTGGGDGCLTEHMDKTVQGELARKVGLPTPKEWIISLRAIELEIPEDVVYPCFCKPVESITGYKKEMAKCESEEELEQHLKKLRRSFSDRSVLVQEFLEIDNEIDLGGVCFDQEVIIPAIIKKTNVAQYEKGVTLAGRVVPFEEMGELQEKVVAMLKEFHYTGMFDMEFNIVGDKVYFNEVNLRSGGPNFSYFMSGVNLPALYVKEAYGEGHTPEDEKVAEYGKDFIYEKVAWDDYLHGFMTKEELDSAIANAAITLLKNDMDPAPWDFFVADMNNIRKKRKVRAVKNAVKRFFKRIRSFFRRLTRPVTRRLKSVILGYPQTKPQNRRNPKSENPRVIIAGRNYCSNLTMARSIGMAGYEAEVIRIFQKKPKKRNLMKLMRPDAYSKYIKAYHTCVTNRRTKRIVNKLIRIADPKRKMLLIPADDLVSSVADTYLEELSEYYYIPNVNNIPGEINRLMEKGVQKQLAKDFGLNVVNSCIIRTVNGQFEIPGTVTYPCFMKPNISKNSSKSRMKKCDSREELEGYLTEFSRKKDVEFIVEDFVEIKKEYSLLGVSTKAGANGPGFFVAEEGGQNEHRGVAVIGRILPCSEWQPLVQNLIDFMSTLNYDGLYDIDLIETVDGQMYFVEINMRFGASGYAVTECGINLPGMFADYMFHGTPIDLDCELPVTGKTFVSEKVLIEEYVMDRMTRAHVDEAMATTDIHFVMNEDDPKAYNHFKKFYPIAGLMRKAYLARDAKNAATPEELDDESGS